MLSQGSIYLKKMNTEQVINDENGYSVTVYNYR